MRSFSLSSDVFVFYKRTAAAIPARPTKPAKAVACGARALLDEDDPPPAAAEDAPEAAEEAAEEAPAAADDAPDEAPAAADEAPEASCEKLASLDQIGA